MLRIRRKLSIITSLILFLIITPINNLTNIGFLNHQNRPLANSQEVIDAVNSLRLANGLPPYQINSILMNIAQTQSDYQASIGSVTHFGPDGSRPFQRALAAGYPVAGDLSLGGFFSENIAAGTNYSSLDAVNSWQMDAPHLNTMLSTSLQDIGAGVSIVGNYVYYTIDVGLSTSQRISTPIGGYPTVDISDHPVINYKILTSTPQIDGTIIHVVKAGETIWSIALAYKVQESEIYKLNSLSGDIIYVGQKLILQLPYTPTPTLPTPTYTPSPSHTPSRTPSFTNTPIPTSISDQTNKLSPYSERNIILSIIFISLLTSSLLAVFWKKKTK
jgi:uncharacterized protein YkwD/LysM repeat protein